MKKIFFIGFISCFFLNICAQDSVNKPFYVFRNDGMINTFFPREVDSIKYSFYDAENLLHEDIVTQIIYTQDSTYVLPLNIIDSISFITPETKYHEGVIVIDGNMESYIMSVDGLTIYFSPNTPTNILPSLGDKLVELAQTDKFPFGFMGEVNSILNLTDSIAVICTALGYEDIFEYLYYVSEIATPTHGISSLKRNLLTNSSDEYAKHQFGAFSIPMNDFILPNLNIFVEKKALTGNSNCQVDVTPTFWTKGSLIVDPLYGVVISIDVKNKTEIEETLSLYGSIEASKDFPTPKVRIPISIPGIAIYGCVGAFIKATTDITMSNYWKQEMRSKVHFEYSFNPIIGLATAKGNLSDVKLENIAHANNGMINGSISAGLFAEIGIEVLHRDLASMALRGEGGLTISGNYIIKESEVNDAKQSTNLYDELKKRTFTLDGFINFQAQAQACNISGHVPITPLNSTFPLKKERFVPLFYDTRLSRMQDQSTLLAKTRIYGNTFLPINVGFKLFAEDRITGTNSTANYRYIGPNMDISDNYYNTSSEDTYTVYPTVELFGVEMLASPGAKLNSNEEDDDVVCLDSPNENVVFFKNTSGWANVYCYAWMEGVTEYLGAWPGVEATPIGNDYYKVELPYAFPDGSEIIWNVGGTQCEGHVDPQTVNLVFQNQSIYEIDGYAPNPSYGILCTTTSEYLPTCTITPVDKICVNDNNNPDQAENPKKSRQNNKSKSL